jgi:hypothetical protein
MYVQTHVKNLLGPGQTLEHNMFVSDRVKETLELSGPEVNQE